MTMCCSTTCVTFRGSSHLSTGNHFFFNVVIHADWHRKLICAAWWGFTSAVWPTWPVLGWKIIADMHETQHTLNGHLLWITRSKMSTGLQAAMFLFCFLSGKWGSAGPLLEHLQLYMNMHSTCDGNINIFQDFKMHFEAEICTHALKSIKTYFQYIISQLQRQDVLQTSLFHGIKRKFGWI